MSRVIRCAYGAILFLIYAGSTQVHDLVPIDKKSSIKFRIRNFGLSVEGSFEGLAGKIRFNPKTIENTSFDVSIKAASVNTNIALRDKHLQKKEYFDIKSFPQISFRSKKVYLCHEPGTYKVEGALTIKNIEKEITIPFKASQIGSDYIFTGKFEIYRQAFGIGGNSLSLSDNVTVFLTVQASVEKGL